jgi:hypothetical protein
VTMASLRVLTLVTLASIQLSFQAGAYRTVKNVCSHPVTPWPEPGSCPVPLDDNTNSDSLFPWTHTPYCVKPANRPKKGPRYCIYTSTTFRGGDGLSVIATPEVAAGLIAAHDDAVIPSRLWTHPANPLLDSDIDPPPYEIQDIPGKGKGAIARQKFKQWQTVMVDFAVAILPMDLFEAVSPAQGRTLMERAIEQLPKETKWTALSLAASTGGGGLVQDILSTNSFGIDIDGIPHVALFPRGSVSYWPQCRGTPLRALTQLLASKS